MNFLNLEYFLVAAQELNFTRAAKKLYISQQSLSIHILKLEEYFEASFFIRSNPLVLTPEGEYFFKRAKEILFIRDITKKEIHDIKNDTKRELIIGAPRAIGRLIFPRIIPHYNKKFPNIHLRLNEGDTAFNEKALYRGDIDLSIGFFHDSISDIASEALYNENILLLVPDQVLAEQYPHNFLEAKQKLKDTVDVRMLKNCPFLVLDPDTHTGAVTLSVFNKLNITPEIVLKSKNIEILISLCFQNMGALFCPEVFLNEAIKGKSEDFLKQIGVYTLKYENTSHTVSVNYLKSKCLSESERGFIDISKSLFEK